MEMDVKEMFGNAGVGMSFADAANMVCDVVTLEAASACAAAKDAFASAEKEFAHNSKLLDDVEAGTEFRIAFKKPGATEWTRVRVDQDSAREAVISEIYARQEAIMKVLADLLGVENLEVIESFESPRDQAKNALFAILYGA